MCDYLSLSLSIRCTGITDRLVSIISGDFMRYGLA